MTPGGRGSVLVGRSDSLSALESARDSGRGSIILGPRGMGKSALAMAAATRGGNFHVVNVHGTEVSSRTPFGALAWLITQLSEDAPMVGASHPMQVFQQLSALLRENSAGKPVLLCIDNAEHLDGSTALVISQLVRTAAVTAIMTATDLLAAPPEVFSLWSDGLLQRIDLEPLTLGQTKELMEKSLGGPVSLRAAGAMWTDTEGNPHFIDLMTGEQVRAGTLVEADGAWVASAPYVRSGAIAEMVAADLARMSSAERRIVEILSFIGSLPLPVILELADADALDKLQENGTLALAGSAVPRVRIGSTMLSSVVTGTVPLGRSREMWEEVSVALDLHGMDIEAVPGYVGWSLACEAQVPAELVRQAASLCNTAGEHPVALSYVRSAPEQERTPELLSEEIRALASMGENHEALRILQRHDPGLAPQQPGWAELMLQKAALLRTVPDAGDARLVLGEVRGHPEAAQGTRCGTALALIEIDLGLGEGNYTEAIAPLLRLAGAQTAPGQAALARSMAAEALCVTGRADEGMALLDGSTVRLLQEPLAAEEQTALLSRVFYACFAAGEYQRALDLLAQLGTGGPGWTYRGSSGELASGLIRAASGQAGAALEHLRPGLSQLRYRDPGNLMPLAAALTAYAYRLQGETDKAAEYIAMSPRFRHKPSWHTERCAVFFKVMASLGENPGVLARRLVQLAEEALSQSNVSFALSCLSEAAAIGDPAAAVQLQAAASSAEGRWARALEAYGAGRTAKDPALLLAAAQGAAELGHHLFAYRAAALIRSEGAAATGRSLARAAQEVENLSFRRLSRENSLESKVEELSGFEAELVRLAAGKMSRTEIASVLSLSPRTIDWHLGKIFDKLHVSGRSELKEALG